MLAKPQVLLRRRLVNTLVSMHSCTNHVATPSHCICAVRNSFCFDYSSWLCRIQRHLAGPERLRIRIAKSHLIHFPLLRCYSIHSLTRWTTATQPKAESLPIKCIAWTCFPYPWLLEVFLHTENLASHLPRFNMLLSQGTVERKHLKSTPPEPVPRRLYSHAKLD